MGGIMFRRFSIFGVVGALVLVAAGGIASALGASDITAPETIVVIDTTTKTGFVNVGPQGHKPTPGDSFLFIDTLTDPTSGLKVGTVHGRCTFELGAWLECQAGAFIGTRGELLLAGLSPASQQPVPFDLPITGGTGEFDNVRGSAHLEPISNRKTKITLSLIP